MTLSHIQQKGVRVCVIGLNSTLLSRSLQIFLWYKYSMQVQMHVYVYHGSAQFFECFSIQDKQEGSFLWISHHNTA